MWDEHVVSQAQFLTKSQHIQLTATVPLADCGLQYAHCGRATVRSSEDGGEMSHKRFVQEEQRPILQDGLVQIHWLTALHRPVVACK